MKLSVAARSRLPSKSALVLARRLLVEASADIDDETDKVLITARVLELYAKLTTRMIDDSHDGEQKP